jgi:GlpG protein
MREIGAISDREAAKLFADYLLTLGIANRVDHEPSGWVVWVRDEDQVSRGREELEQFLRHEEVQRERDYNRRVVDVRSQWGRMTMRRRPVTLVVIGICLVVGVLTELGDAKNGLKEYLFISDVVWHNPVDHTVSAAWTRIAQGQIWRLITPIFLHFNMPHIVFNLWAWYVLASIFEIRRGSWRLLIFTLVTAAVSNAAQYEYAGSPLFGGMSGVIYGLFGYIWMKSRFDPAAGMYMDPMNTIIMIAWLFLCMTGMIGPIANTAHVVGLVVGVLVGVAPIVVRRLR